MRRLLLAALAVGLSAGCVTEPKTPTGLPRRVKLRVEGEDGRWTPVPVGRDLARAVAEGGGREGRREPSEGALSVPGLLPPAALRQDVGISPYHRFSHRTIREPDGRFTRLYYLRAYPQKVSEQIVTLVAEHTRADPKDIRLHTSMLVDPRKNQGFPKGSMLENVLPGVDVIADLLMVTGTEDVLYEVDQFLSTLLLDTPQIEIEAKVVEMSLDDLLEYGSNLTIREVVEKLDDQGNLVSKGNDKSTAFTKFTSPLDPDAFLSGQQVATLAVSFFEDDLKFKAFFRAIQNSSSSDVLSAPKMAVLNGHRAVIDTGARIPVQTPVLGAAGQLTQVQVKFEETGVRLIVTPYLLMDDVIQVDVVAEVSFVSSFVEAGATGILNPVISQRTASTVVNVRDGQTLMIAGLVSTSEIELVSKVPVLGDIPVLGALFRTKSVTEQQNQVIFFITPRIVRPTAPLFEPGL